MMKKVINFFLSVGLFVVIGTSFNSCAPSAPDETYTTTLFASPSSVTLTRTNTSQDISVGLSCGCTFEPLQATFYGDTNVIHFTFKEPLTDLMKLHTIHATIDPSTLPPGPGTATASIALYFLDGGTHHLYDTVHVIATY